MGGLKCRYVNMALMSRLTCCNIGQSKTACLLWAYCETLKLIETLLPMNGLSYLDHRELNLIKKWLKMVSKPVQKPVGRGSCALEHRF